MRFRKNILWSFFGTTVYALMQWMLLVALAKLTTSSEVGRFSLGLAITAPIIMFTNMRLRLVQATDAVNAHQFGVYFTARLLTSTAALVLVLAIAFSGLLPIEMGLVVLLIGCSKVIESLSDITYGLFQKNERMDKVGISLLIKSLLSLVVFTGAIFWMRDVVYAIFVLAGAWLMLLVFYDLKQARSLLEDVAGSSIVGCCSILGGFSTKGVRNLILGSFSLAFVASFWSLATNIPKYFVGYYLGEELLGIYAAIGYMGIAGMLVIGSISQPLLPRFALAFHEGEYKKFVKYYLITSLIAIIIGVGGVLFSYILGRWFLDTVYSPEYGKHVDIFILLMLAVAINYHVLLQQYIFTTTKFHRIQVVQAMLSIALLAIMASVLVPRFGLKGMAIGEIISMFGVFVFGFIAMLLEWRKLTKSCIAPS